MGFHDEKQMLMNADHRSICKFDSIADTNYQILRNSLDTTVTKILNMGDYSRPCFHLVFH